MRRSPLIISILTLSLFACGPDLETASADELRSSSTKTTTTTKKTRETSSSSWTVRTTDARITGIEPTWKSAFVIASTVSVEIATDLPATASGHHVLSVLVYSPSGATYQRFDIPFAAGVAPDPNEIAAETTTTGFRVWASLPVMATHIDSFGMTGTWRADSYLDFATAPAASASFSLQH